MGRNLGINWGQELGLARRVAGMLGEDGKVISVDASGAGDVNNSQEAIDFCVDARGDVIVRKAGGESVTETVAFNKKAISYITEGYGAAPGALGELFSIYADAGFIDGPVATITKRCYIEGIAFASKDAGSLYYAGAAALIGGMSDQNPFGAWLHLCRFPKWGFTNRIGLAIEGSSDCRVSSCFFEGVGADFDSGIYLQGAMANIDIWDNVFRDCTYGILTGNFAAGPEAIIMRNIFHASKALSVASAAPIFFADNWMSTATDTGSYNDTVTNLKNLGVEFVDNHYPT